MRGPSATAGCEFSAGARGSTISPVLWPHCPRLPDPSKTEARPQTHNGVGRRKDQAQPWAAKDGPLGCGGPRSSPPSSHPSSQARAAGPGAPFKLGRGGTRGPGPGETPAPRTSGGLDPKEPHGPVCPRITDHRPAPVSLLPHRTYPNLPPTASPSWRRANGAPCARKPQKWGRLPRATPEPKGTTLVPPNCTLSRPRSTKTQKICSGSQKPIFAGLFPFK